MSRPLSPPVHLHVGRKTPVHLHIKPGKKRFSKLEQQQLSCSAMSAGKPCVNFSASQNSRSGHWISPSSSKSGTPWVPPPGNTRKSRMAWEGRTHRLEIHPDPSGSTVLHLSDLSGDDSTDILDKGCSYQKKVQSLKAEMDHLKAEVDLQKSLRELEERGTALKDSMKEAELSYCHDELEKSEMENVKLKESLSRSVSPCRRSPCIHSPCRRRHSPCRSVLDAEEKMKRDRLLAQLAEVEVEGIDLRKHAKKLKTSIRKLQKDRRFVSVDAAQVAENKDIFLGSLSQFEKSNEYLSKLVQSQEAYQTSVGQLTEHRDLLEKKLDMSESTNQLLKEKLEEQEHLAMHSQSLHNEIGQRDGEIQSLTIQLQSVEEQLCNRDLECSQLQSELSGVMKQYHKDKEVLKKATKQHKDRAKFSERTLETVGDQLEEANVEFSRIKGKLLVAKQELMSRESEITSLKMKIHELETSLSQTRTMSKVSVDAVSSQLAEKTEELNCLRLENDSLRTLISSADTQQRNNNSSHLAKMSEFESQVSQLNSSLAHCQKMVAEYRGQLDRSRVECERLVNEVRVKEQEMQQLKQESSLEEEKYRLKYQQKLADFEPMPEMLKNSEQRLVDAQERLLTYEQRCGEQTRLIAELSMKAEQNATIIDSLKDKLHESVAERRVVENRLGTAEKKQLEFEHQNKELIGISGRKEDMVQRLQGRVEELVQEVSGASAHQESIKADYRRQSEQIKERSSNKERAHLARISDLESQLGRANSLATQFRKSKDDLERRYHSRVHELQDKLEQANSTRRSLDNYITFLKSSYTSVFGESSHVPGSPIPPATH